METDLAEVVWVVTFILALCLEIVSLANCQTYFFWSVGKATQPPEVKFFPTVENRGVGKKNDKSVFFGRGGGKKSLVFCSVDK